ncbi:hypothetical protein SERLA73DRAFT_92039 [Serpula lacrymans var. lacrymans S7.3]|uniref:Rad4-domain-containing protein n=1 Tax=Serpula lacrymans var. lacrymans (strain S7.3) TaxID=936435 RepID=F8Q0D9_SERL3|nr:hypothetical protein SERLA73DRAFT_92039 [Serpula lacrymans var. lacrymans S7.3]
MAEYEISPMDDNSDDDFEWEEVDVPNHAPQLPAGQELELQIEDPPARENIEITLLTRPKKDDAKKKSSAISHADRLVRTECHKLHTICLLANARIRNQWLNDELLHARLLSLTPLSIQNGFAMIHKSRIPDPNKRGRLFESAITRLVDWWTGTFFSVLPSGHIRSKTFDEVQKELSMLTPDQVLDLEDIDDDLEVVRSEKSLMKHALMQQGSRDTSAQLFTALCRALDIPARLVVSLQSVPWQAGVGKPKPKTVKKKAGKEVGKGKGKEKAAEEDPEEAEEEDMEEVEIPTKVDLKGKGKANDASGSLQGNEQKLDRTSAADHKGKGKEKAQPVIKLRKAKGKSYASGSSSNPVSHLKSNNPLTIPPVFWTEVFSRADLRWLPVDPIRGIVNKRKIFDPLPSTSAGPASATGRQENRMLYVISLEEDGYGRDVTPRYARDYTAKVAKVQGVGSGAGGRRKEWWERVVRIITRPYRLERDDLEDDELHNHQLTEGMPTTIAGFKDHPLYVLARHLRREEVIDPPTELGKFRGEPVYPRSSVISLKTAENWMRQGRKVREGCQPMKMVKQRAATVNKRREIELALERAREDGSGGAGEEEMLQGMYARSQTELYQPEPIIDGKIPKNDFGNIDLYVPTMLPKGGAHIPFKGVAKIARKLGFDYAEAVTGFEFRKQRANPVIEGIVVASENEAVLLEAYWEAEQNAEEKARIKRQEQVLKRWTRLIHGLRIRQRLQKQYATDPEREQPELHWVDKQAPEVGEEPGGFLTTADDVVKPFQLPKYHHTAPTSSFEPPLADRGDQMLQDSTTATIDSVMAVDDQGPSSVDHSALDIDVIISDIQPQRRNGAPITMRELAEGDARKQEVTNNSPVKFVSDTATADTAESSRSNSALKSSLATASKKKGDTNTASASRSTLRKTAKKRARADSLSDDDSKQTSPQKRGRKSATSTPIPTPSRVLRPRGPKSAAKVQQEMEMEMAYREAIAE